MALDHSLVGLPGEPHERSWTSTDALLYAIAVGAGLGDPLRELEFTTENSSGIEQQVLPTFGVLVAQARPGRTLGTFDRARLVHAEQAFELHRPLPVAGTARTISTVTGIYDKGSGALVVSENVAVDAATGATAADQHEQCVHPRRGRLRRRPRPAGRRELGPARTRPRPAGAAADPAGTGAALPADR